MEQSVLGYPKVDRYADPRWLVQRRWIQRQWIQMRWDRWRRHPGPPAVSSRTVTVVRSF